MEMAVVGVLECFVSVIIAVVSLILCTVLYLLKKKDKRNRFLLILSAICLICTLLLSGYMSLDLLYKDFLTTEGVYLDSSRISGNMICYFDTGEEEKDGFTVYSERYIDCSILEEGKEYVLVYAKRTNALISIEKSDG